MPPSPSKIDNLHVSQSPFAGYHEAALHWHMSLNILYKSLQRSALIQLLFEILRYTTEGFQISVEFNLEKSEFVHPLLESLLGQHFSHASFSNSVSIENSE